MKTLPLAFAVLSALMPVITQKTGLSAKHGFKMKMLCAFMYFATGVLSALSLHDVSAYSLSVLGALLLGVLGDFFLSYKQDSFFTAGMAFFALGHIAYIITLSAVGEGKALLPAVGLSVIMYLSLIYLIGRLKFKKHRGLILLYGAVLVFFFSCALITGIFCICEGRLAFGLCLAAGGALFFASDLMIGIGKGGINRPAFMHNAVSYTYFAAQTLFALSIYFR